MTGRGVVCFITNSSWLTGSSYVVMRQSLLRSFNRIWIENMHGDRKITEYGPDGRSSETVFAIDRFSVGIRQGVAISTFARTEPGIKPNYLFRNDINASDAALRRADLLASLDDAGSAFDARYAPLDPLEKNRFNLWPGAATERFATWPTTAALSAIEPITGLKENRGFVLVQADRTQLINDIHRYFDRKVSFDTLREEGHRLTLDAARFDARKARKRALAEAHFDEYAVRRYILRPFDFRWCYYIPVRPLWNEPRPSLVHHHAAPNGFLVTRPLAIADPEGFPAHWVRHLADFDYIRGHSYHHAAVLVAGSGGSAGTHAQIAFGRGLTTHPNLSDIVKTYLDRCNLSTSPDTSRLVWHRALAITYSPAYLAENAAGIRQGWPRIPLPNDGDLLRASAALGARLALLLDSDTPVPGVTAGAIEPALAPIGVPTTRPGMEKNWRLTGWGHRTDKGVTMPGRGQSTLRPYAPDEAATEAHAALLGAQTRDVGMNGASFWKNIPEQVWETHIGGYQVLKKWLSYRDASILDRALSAEEVAHVQGVARRLAAILLMGPELDASFRACAAAHVPLPQG